MVTRSARADIVIILFVIIIIVFLLFYFFGLHGRERILEEDNSNFNNVSGEVDNETLIGINETKKDATSNNTLIDSEEVHWNHMPLTYKIKDKVNCKGQPIEKFEEALSIIEESTKGIVNFSEVDSEEFDISVACVDGISVIKNLSIICENMTFDYDKRYIHPEAEELIGPSDFFISSELVLKNESETTYEICYIDDGKNVEELMEGKAVVEGNVIKNAMINIYRTGSGWNSCTALPAREMHNLFHVFGFGHSEVPLYESLFGWASLNYLRDVMFPYLYCKYQTEVDEKYFLCLKKIYSEGVEGDCSNVNF